MHTPTSEPKGLPLNAYTELKPGEEYIPIMSPNKQYPEVSIYSVLMGLLMAVIFSMAAAYLGLKIGQVFEAAIPIAIIAVGVSSATKKEKCPWRKYNYPVYRCNVRSCSSRSNIYYSCSLHT
jgi:hypothetical protein